MTLISLLNDRKHRLDISHFFMIVRYYARDVTPGIHGIESCM